MIESPYSFGNDEVIDGFKRFLNVENLCEIKVECEYWGMTKSEMITFILKEGLLEVRGMRETAQAWDRKQEGRE